MLATTRQDARVMEARYEDYSVTIRNYIGTGGQVGDGGPQAYLANVPPGKVVHPHFHPVDQFQVFFGSDGSYFERKAIVDLHVQYADAYTPYGPFGAGTTELDFFTLRARATSEHHPMPGSRDKMVRKAGRSVHAHVALGGPSDQPAGLSSIIERKPDGLAAYHLRVSEGESAVAPSPEGSAGQYFIVVKGAMRCNAGLFPFQSCLYLGAEEAPLQMNAGDTESFEVLVLQYPRASQ